ESGGGGGGGGAAVPGGPPPALFRRLAALPVMTGPREWLTVHAPWTGAALGQLPRCNASDVVEAVARARAAQPAWAAWPVRKRARVLLNFHKLLFREESALLDLIQVESGKARRHAFEEVMDTAGVARHYAFRAEKYLKPRRRRGALPLLTVTQELHHPVGVVGCIAPWNFPLILSITDLLPALLAGNAAVLKPDRHASFTALRAVELLREAGLPPDVLQVVTGEGAVLGTPLIENVDFVMFTGSTRTGKIIAEQAARRLINYSLELGGKNPLIVLDDVDLDHAVEGALRGSFVGAGQVCVSIERLYVHEKIFEAFATRFAERARALKLSASLDWQGDVGSITSESQLETIDAHVQDAVARGARVLAGGRRRPDVGPLFYEPTVLVGVQPGMRCYAEETFGPVVSLYHYRTVDEAIERANDTTYGLNAAVWGRDARRAFEVASRIRAGSVNINEGYGATWASTDSPIGGFKESGMGRRHGAEGIRKYTEAQTISRQRWLPLSAPGDMPYQRWAGIISRLLKLQVKIPGVR
ncbi:MAG TPA: succinic semialdehyde dehydrogenase, partial [Longimicrobiales bacterium]